MGMAVMNIEYVFDFTFSPPNLDFSQLDTLSKSLMTSDHHLTYSLDPFTLLFQQFVPKNRRHHEIMEF